MSRHPVRQRGVSLVELLVGIGVALILLTGIVTLMLRVSTQGAASVQGTHLNQQLRGNLDFISKELQRSGYVNTFAAFDTNGDGAITEADNSYTGAGDSIDYINALDFYASVMPVLDLFGEVRLFDSDGNACTTDCACILYSYDLDNDGFQGVGAITPADHQDSDNYELFGIRFVEASGDIEMLTSGPHSCTEVGSVWQAINDDTVEIADFGMDLVYVDPATTDGDSAIYAISPGGGTSFDSACTVAVGGDYPQTGDTVCLWRRMVDLTMTGRLSDEPDVFVELETNIKLKNDYFETQ